MEMDIDLHSFY